MPTQAFLLLTSESQSSTEQYTFLLFPSLVRKLPARFAVGLRVSKQALQKT